MIDYKEHFEYIKVNTRGDRFFKCTKCMETVEEFLLHAHILDHENPDALFGDDAVKKLKELGIDPNVMHYNEDM